MLQIWVSMKAMPIYTGLPAVSEYMIEKGWTKAFARVEDVGLPTYLCLVVAYMAIVEFGIYWMHRELHDIKPLYKYLHATHHIYNKQNTLSPFAGTISKSLIPDSKRVFITFHRSGLFEVKSRQIFVCFFLLFVCGLG